MSMLIEAEGYRYMVNEVEFVDAIVEHTQLTRNEANRFVWGAQQGNPHQPEQIVRINLIIAHDQVCLKLANSLSECRRAQRLKV